MACIDGLWDKVKEKVSEWVDRLFGGTPEGAPSENNEEKKEKE